MVLIADGGGGGPTLDPKAKHFERELYKVFSSSTSTIWLTQEDWRGAKTQLEDLAKDVQQVRTELQAPGDGGAGWQGPAAEAALASLEKLGTTLDGHAAKIGDVDTSLGQVYQAISDAKAGWYSDVASISTYVDPSDHMRLPAPYLPTPENKAQYSVPDADAAAAAEDAKWEQRNQAAKKVLEQLGSDTQTATGTMPIETKTKSETPYSSNGPGPSTNYPTRTSTPSGGGGYQIGGPAGPGFTIGPTDPGGDPDDDPTPIPNPEQPEEITIGDPEGPDPDPTYVDPISSDGDVTGTTGGPTGTTSGSSTYNGGGGGGGMGVGGVAAGGVGTGAAGLGGLLGARGGGMFGARGGGVMPAGGAQGRGTGAGARGGTSFRPGGAAGAAGRGGQVIPGGGQGRGSAAGRASSVKGASGSGRYGVPKLDGKGGVAAGSGQGAKGGARSGAGANGRGSAARGSGRNGASGAAGAAGGRGSRKGDKDQTQDVDNLTHEDEETWYDGTEESSPQVWQ